MRKYLVVLTRRKVMRIPIEEIFYLLKRGRKITVYYNEGEVEYSGTMEEAERYLDGRFFKALNSIYINLDRIRIAADGILFFDDGSTLVLSRETYVRTKQRFFSYIRDDLL